MNLNQTTNCGRDLKEVAPENQQPPPTTEAKPDCAPRLGAWVDAKEKLPTFLTPVLVMNTERHMAFAPFGCWKGVGVLNGKEMRQPYWSMMGGDGALCLDAVTHWLLIPDAPNDPDQGRPGQ